MKKFKGVNLFEVMIAIAITAIVTVMAIPSMRSLWQNNRASTLATNFASTLAYARSEAIKRGTPVSVCPSSDTLVYSSCGNSGQWNNGWIVFADPKGDGVIADPNQRLQTEQSIQGGASITTTQGRITFQGSGFVSSGLGNYLMRATSCTGNNARLIQLESTGRFSTTDAACP